MFVGDRVWTEHSHSLTWKSQVVLKFIYVLFNILADASALQADYPAFPFGLGMRCRASSLFPGSMAKIHTTSYHSYISVSVGLHS